MGSTKFGALLVEEDLELATGVMTSLTQGGFECRHVSDTALAMPIFRSQQPHLVLLSLGLPRIGGATLCAPIRQISSVPIVILSVRTRKEDHLHALNLGADEFITLRPFEEQLMMARILTLMRRVYHYRPLTLAEPLDTQPLQKPQSQLPSGWATCDSCNYMGPQRRFDRINAKGEPAIMCPHCDRTQNLVFSIA